jgi:LPXTG-site transpeptidase (sortase) family protein
MSHRKGAMLILLLGGLIFIIIMSFLAFGIPGKPPAQIAAPVPKVASLPVGSYRGLPTRLKIPAINIDVAIESVGNTPKGDMAAPSDVANVGWYKYGALPGELGSSVLAGHVVGSKGEPVVFAKLDKLKAGDILSVVDAKGIVVSFTVRELKSYDQTQQPSEVFNSGSGIHLNLITCAGDWDAAQRHYLKRLVVFADKSS